MLPSHESLQAAGIVGGENGHLLKSKKALKAIFKWLREVDHASQTEQLLFTQDTCLELLQKDKHDECLWTWSYPTFSQAYKSLVASKCCLYSQSNNEEQISFPFVYFQHDKLWFYLSTSVTSADTSLTKVSQFCIVLLSKDFHPEKYSALSRLFSEIYDATGDPTQLLERYLKVITCGECNSNTSGSFNVRDFSSATVHKASLLKDVVLTFGIESVILYTAVLLKKKILVFEENVLSMLDIVRALPSFCYHRSDWSIVYPWVDDLTALSQLPSFIAGVCQKEKTLNDTTYDVLVDASKQQIEVSEHAKGNLSLGKIHKDIAKTMVDLSKGDDVTSQQLIQTIARKTEEVLTKLQSLSVDGELTFEAIKARNLNPNTENFLIQLAAAEQLIRT